MPLAFYAGIGIASRSTLWRWEAEGLRIIRKGGRTYVQPADLRAFLLSNDTSVPISGGGTQENPPQLTGTDL